MERLLRYSLEHDRVIRLMLMREETLSQVNARVIHYDADRVDFITTRWSIRASSRAAACRFTAWAALCCIFSPASSSAHCQTSFCA